MKEQTIDLRLIIIMIAMLLFIALLHIAYNNITISKVTISKTTTDIGVMQWSSDTCWRGSWNY